MGYAYLMLRIFAVVVLIGATVSTGFAQVCHLSTTFRVIQNDAQPITSITPDQVQVEIDSKPAKVSSLSLNPKPLIVLLIDDSGSVKSTREASVSAARALANSAGDEIAAFVFREEIVAEAYGRQETAKLLDQLSTSVPQNGGSAIYDTLIRIIGPMKTRNAAIVVITDGEDNASSHSLEDTLNLFLQHSWPPVFGLLVDYDHSDKRRAALKKIVDVTGGASFIPRSESKVAETAASLSGELIASFTVALEASQPISKAAKLKIEILGAGKERMPHMKVLHISEVQGCDPTESSPGKQ